MKGVDSGSVSSEISPKRHIARKTKNKLSNLAIRIALLVFFLIWILPVIGIVIESFHCSGTDSVVGSISGHWGFDNYARLFRDTLFLKWFGNTFLVGIATAIVQTAFQLSVGYSLSRFRFKGRKVLTYFLFVFGMCPSTLTLIAVNSWLRSWNLTGANAPYGSFIIYAANSGMGYSVVKGFFDTVDRSIDEAARMDGATQFQIFYKIFLPLAKPIIIYTLYILC